MTGRKQILFARSPLLGALGGEDWRQRMTSPGLQHGKVLLGFAAAGTTSAPLRLPRPKTSMCKATKLANKQRLAKKHMELSRGAAMLRAWLIPKEAAVASPHVASGAQARRQGAGSGVACVDGVKNESLPEPAGAGDNKQQVLDLLAVVSSPGASNSLTEQARTPSRKRSGDNHQGARGAARPRTSEGGASGDVGGSTPPATGKPRHGGDVVRM
ncbi:unnamed protein product [Ectocarpus sp. CCAP 1310/34]|nr:unnamed protein product [Ectocarpus sp. CCAP 1310/34]